MTEMVRAYLRIYGLVQGVFFRSSMREVAWRLGVTGWVRNLPDGSVEAVVEGPKEAVLKIIDWAHEGPPSARVEKVEVRWEKYKGEFNDFRIRYWW
jgi:acylphosphatase